MSFTTKEIFKVGDIITFVYGPYQGRTGIVLALDANSNVAKCCFVDNKSKVIDNKLELLSATKFVSFNEPLVKGHSFSFVGNFVEQRLFLGKKISMLDGFVKQLGKQTTDVVLEHDKSFYSQAFLDELTQEYPRVSRYWIYTELWDFIIQAQNQVAEPLVLNEEGGL